MTQTPVPLPRTPLRDRPSFYVTVAFLALSIIGFVIFSHKLTTESKQRTQQLQDVICGVYVPIGNSPLPPAASQLGRTIVAATRHGAVSIHCPGLKPPPRRR